MGNFLVDGPPFISLGVCFLGALGLIIGGGAAPVVGVYPTRLLGAVVTQNVALLGSLAVISCEGRKLCPFG